MVFTSRGSGADRTGQREQRAGDDPEQGAVRRHDDAGRHRKPDIRHQEQDSNACRQGAARIQPRGWVNQQGDFQCLGNPEHHEKDERNDADCRPVAPQG